MKSYSCKVVYYISRITKRFGMPIALYQGNKQRKGERKWKDQNLKKKSDTTRTKGFWPSKEAQTRWN